MTGPVGQVGCPGGFQHPVQGPGAVHPGLGRVLQFGDLQVQFLVGAERGRGDGEAEAGGQAGPDGPQLDHHGIDATGQDERAAGRKAGHERGRDGLDLDAAVSLAGAHLAAHGRPRPPGTARSWTPGR